MYNIMYNLIVSESSHTSESHTPVESLTHSVPPLSESGLNLPALPPAYIEIKYLPEETVVSTLSFIRL